MRALRVLYNWFSPRDRERIKLFLGAHGHTASPVDYLKARDYAAGKKRLDRTAQVLGNMMTKAGIVSLDGKACMEFGAGYVPTETLVFHLLGARSVVAVDYNPIARFKSLVVAAQTSDRAEILKALRPFTASAELERRLDILMTKPAGYLHGYIAEHITYVAPFDMSWESMRPRVDFIHSLSVLEHVAPATAVGLVRNLADSLKKDGVMISEIDLMDHRDPVRAPFAFLSASDDYDQVSDYDRRGNRFRLSDWEAVFRGHPGFRTEQIHAECLPASLVPDDYERALFGDNPADIAVSRAVFASTRL